MAAAAKCKVMLLAMLLAIIEVIGFSPAISRASAADTARPKRISAKAVVARLQRHYQATDSLSANFKQTLTRAGAPARERTGRFSYKRPGRMRWEFAAPQPETIVSDGTTIYDYDPGLNQVVETPVKEAFRNKLAAAFFLGVGNLERDFTAFPLSVSPPDGFDHLALTPKGGGDRIELGIDASTSDIRTLTVSDSLGNRTTFDFTDIRRNKELSPSLFAFTPPAGADIVNSTESSQK
jgi:outer membrane lipoprotein carrier protein